MYIYMIYMSHIWYIWVIYDIYESYIYMYIIHTNIITYIYIMYISIHTSIITYIYIHTHFFTFTYYVAWKKPKGFSQRPLDPGWNIFTISKKLQPARRSPIMAQKNVILFNPQLLEEFSRFVPSRCWDAGDLETEAKICSNYYYVNVGSPKEQKLPEKNDSFFSRGYFTHISRAWSLHLLWGPKVLTILN